MEYAGMRPGGRGRLSVADALDELATVIARWLQAHHEQAFFVSEVEAMAGRSGLDPAGVRPALTRLAEQGTVFCRRYDFDDPHIPSSALMLVAWQVEEDPRAVLTRVEHQWKLWLKEFLASHRCT